MLEVWILTIYLTTGGWLEGGQYVDRDKCETAGAGQIRHWRRVYGARTTWRCEFNGAPPPPEGDERG